MMLMMMLLLMIGFTLRSPRPTQYTALCGMNGNRWLFFVGRKYYGP
jgi:hypothetical protein